MRMARFARPLHYAAPKPTWSTITGVLAIGVVWAAALLSNLQPDWRVPLEQDVRKVSGTFTDKGHDGNLRNRFHVQPYEFISDSGEGFYFGCDPEIESVECLEQSGVSMQQLVQRHATVGYFKVRVPWWKRTRYRMWPDILLTVDTNGHSLLTFPDSRARLERDYSNQRVTTTATLPLWGLEMVVAVIAIFGSIRLAIIKLRQSLGGKRQCK